MRQALGLVATRWIYLVHATRIRRHQTIGVEPDAICSTARHTSLQTKVVSTF